MDASDDDGNDTSSYCNSSVLASDSDDSDDDYNDDVRHDANGSITAAFAFGGAWGSVRRRQLPRSNSGSEAEDDNLSSTNYSYRSHSKTRRKHKSHSNAALHLCMSKFRPWWSRISTAFLVFCFVFWLVVQTCNVFRSINQTTLAAEASTMKYGKVGQDSPNARRRRRTRTLPPRTADGLWSDVKDVFYDLVGLPVKVYHSVSRGEDLEPGCVRAEWQDLNLPDCNDMHETDLREVWLEKSTKTATTNTSSLGYVASGYWRDVWLVDPRQESLSEDDKHHKVMRVVLKMMKSEHKSELRNFERHRRDALAMERLTSSPYTVDIYSYCGNSVLTEYVGRDMHQILVREDDKEFRIEPERERIRYALEVIKGVEAMHEIEGGPIVHSDIADKQFLVDSDGHVKLNDFNRCRFMGYHEHSGEKCTFHIPTSPGRNRSPEEYDDKELTEQLDVYSTAHVLYQILTGQRAFFDLPTSQLKKAVKHGTKPPLEEKWRKTGTADAVLADLIERAYERDPKERITASEIARTLEQVLKDIDKKEEPPMQQ